RSRAGWQPPLQRHVSRASARPGTVAGDRVPGATQPRRHQGAIPMFNHHVHKVLARPRPAAEGTPTVLRDGSTVLIRQVRGTDAPLLADGFARLSARSRQMRFLGPKKMLSAAELRYLTQVDHHDHEAIGALSPAEGRGVGVARYIRDADDPRAAEIAVTIADHWQGRGLGPDLLARLSERSREPGIGSFHPRRC